MCSSFSKKCNWPLCKDFLRDTRQRPVHVAGFFYLGALPWRISNKERRMTKMPFNIHYSLFLVHYSQSGLLLVTSRRILFSVRCVAHLCVPFAIQQQKTSNYLLVFVGRTGQISNNFIKDLRAVTAFFE